VTNPTYPNPTTVTRMSSPSQRIAAIYRRADVPPPPRAPVDVDGEPSG
jgi:hypothetical protein